MKKVNSHFDSTGKVVLYPKYNLETLHRINDFWDLDELDEDGALSNFEIATLPLEELHRRADVEFGEGTSDWDRKNFDIPRPANTNRALSWIQRCNQTFLVMAAAFLALAVSYLLNPISLPSDLNEKRLANGGSVVVGQIDPRQPSFAEADKVQPLLTMAVPGFRDSPPSFTSAAPLIRISFDRHPKYSVPFLRQPVARPPRLRIDAPQNLSVQAAAIEYMPEDTSAAFAGISDALETEIARLLIEADAPGWSGVVGRYSPSVSMLITPSARTYDAAAARAGLPKDVTGAIYAELKRQPGFDEYRLKLGDRIDAYFPENSSAKGIIVYYTRGTALAAPGMAPVVCLRTEAHSHDAILSEGTCADTAQAAVVQRAAFTPVTFSE